MEMHFYAKRIFILKAFLNIYSSISIVMCISKNVVKQFKKCLKCEIEMYYFLDDI